MTEIATRLRFIRGDATRPQGGGAKIIAHICNDVGAWGKGFVLALSRRWNQPEAAYRAWHAGKDERSFELGAIQLVQVEPGLWVANMVAQHGIRKRNSEPPIRYDAVGACLQQLAAAARELGASVHMPRIGTGLAGGDWSRIERLVQEQLCDQGVDVTVYDLLT
jgi:O-acetyl-ADP-ribose deacetylase (regulator of RNase III)